MNATQSIPKETLRTDLEDHFEEAVIHALHEVAGLDVWRVSEDEQQRHTGRTITCQMTLFGDGWLGSLLLLMPFDGAERVTARFTEDAPRDSSSGSNPLHEALGALSAGIGISLARSFTDDKPTTVGLPLVVQGDALGISFPWDNHFETRLSFKSDASPFWAMLRLSKLPRS